jgi:hypothetical protein
MSRRKEPVVPADLLDQLLAGGGAAAALQQGGLLESLKKALAERALNAEMDHHLGHDDRPATTATAMAARPWSRIPARSRSRCPVTVRAASIRN